MVNIPRMDGPTPPIPVSSPRVPFARTSASVLLDLVRGLAALTVMISHWRNLLFEDYNSLPHYNPLLVVFYGLTAAGHQAVLVFFVLSGYLIGGSIFRSLRAGRWSWVDYLLHRFTRLWIVLIPGLLLCALWDWVGLYHTRAGLLYRGQVPNHVIHDVYSTFSTRIFFGNVAFLQTLFVPTFGSDGALWSLCNEFWYYMLFPLAILSLWGSTRLLPRLLYAGLFAVLAWKVCLPLLPYFLFWLAGVALTQVSVLRLRAWVRVVAAGVYAVLFFGSAHYPLYTQFQTDAILCGLTFLFFWVMLSATAEAPQHAGARFARTISSFSYTLYVVHLPLLLLITALAVGNSRWDPSPAHLAIAFWIMFGTVLYAWGIAACSEVHTHQVVARLKRLAEG